MPFVDFKTLVASGCSGAAVISFPTDTVPALATRPDCAELIFATKKRNLDKPLILMGGTAADLWPYVSGSDEELQIWQQVAARYWPGALTLVLPASNRTPRAMNPLDPTTIGVRVPQRAIAQAILNETGPLATTSANYSGQPPLQTLLEIEQQFPNVLTLTASAVEQLERQYAADQPTLVTQPASGIPSTVARWDRGTWVILRQGAIHLD